MKLWSRLSGKRFLRCLPWDGCWQPLISVTMEISPSPSPPPAVCQSALFAKIAAAVHPPLPFYLSTTTSSLNLLSGVQMPCRVLPVWVQIILQMTNMPERERAGGSVVWRLSFQENCQGAVEQGSERLSRAAYTLKNIPQWLHVFFVCSSTHMSFVFFFFFLLKLATLVLVRVSIYPQTIMIVWENYNKQ